MRVCLIHYDVNRLINEPGNSTVMKHFGHMPNIQLLYVASILESLGVELCYIDMLGMNIDRGDLEKKLKQFNPDLIGLSVYTSHFHSVANLTAYLKSFLPHTKIIAGGVHTLIFPTETMQYNRDIDYVCVGEAEMVMPEFVRRWESNEGFDGLRGLVWRDGESIQYAGPPDACNDLDSVPFPARHLIPNEKYFNFISTRHNYTVFNTSRGCPFRCLFCEAGGQKWRARSAENVVDEFEVCYEQFGVREVDIFDSSFTINKQRVLNICQELIKRGLHRKVIWNVRSRVDTIDEEMLDLLKEAGCYRIFYGIESGNPEILKKLKKMADLKRMEEIVRKTDDVGISTFGYFLFGSPGETSQTLRETVNFAKSLPLDFAIFNCLTPFPRTALYEEYYLPHMDKDFWAEYIKSPDPNEKFVGRPWTDIQDAELRRLAHKAMLEFYFRPSQLARALKSIHSVEQFWRYARAGLDMSLAYLGNGLKSAVERN